MEDALEAESVFNKNKRVLVLILVLMEDALEAEEGTFFKRRVKVLILVLMENALEDPEEVCGVCRQP